ncbi:hypothetical protein H634G_08365 [Metarhizium anisopliae BRIP 53293]|uniref:C2H2-type domain-containing protein n=1 Tax=Metarhizium anisopliae BRIP 53293 TaxID=1291518 RepID=A0A0D9NUJ6_METAN|nr:hypothetical protein H634G_08365 [Metarhizium anisopliae BRIP 53293]KJK89550.1 hypothetical protein H633G_06582 [Metarhizium anisopliae BRIP 53284]
MDNSPTHKCALFQSGVSLLDNAELSENHTWHLEPSHLQHGPWSLPPTHQTPPFPKARNSECAPCPDNMIYPAMYPGLPESLMADQYSIKLHNSPRDNLADSAFVQDLCLESDLPFDPQSHLVDLDTMFDVRWAGASAGLASRHAYTATTEDASPEPSNTSESSDWVPKDVYEMGFLDDDGNWRCSYAGCRSGSIFHRACDLRKHYVSHTKVFFCARPECAALGLGFAARKDYERHMRSHQPNIACLDASCNRVFSRMDNMKPLLQDAPTTTKYPVSETLSEEV